MNFCESSPCLEQSSLKCDRDAQICICRAGYQGRLCQYYGNFILYRNKHLDRFISAVDGSSCRGQTSIAVLFRISEKSTDVLGNIFFLCIFVV